MPCSDGGPSYGRTEYIENPETKRRLDRATRLLCEVMHTLSDKHPGIAAGLETNNPDLGKWWAAHQKEDEARRRAEAQAAEKEAARKAASAKLTPAERKALGL